MKVRGHGGLARLLACGMVLAGGACMSGCKAVTEKYIALEVWKYEKCFGHLPPGFVPPGAAQPAAAPGRICGQGGPCQSGCQGPTGGCDQCVGGEAGHVVPGGLPAGAGVPAGPGGSPGPALTPTATHFRGAVSKPVVISDEVVIP